MYNLALFEEIEYHIFQEIRKAQHSILFVHSRIMELSLYRLLSVKAAEGLHVELIVPMESQETLQPHTYQNIIENETHKWKINYCSHPLLLAWFQKYPLWIIDSNVIVVAPLQDGEQSPPQWDFLLLSKENASLSFFLITELRNIAQNANLKNQATSYRLDYAKVNKRLELLKNAILLEAEQEEIEEHFERLAKLVSTHDLEQASQLNQLIHIYEKKIIDKELPYIVALIDSYFTQQKAVALSIDVDSIIYDIQLKLLEFFINALENEKTELQKQFLAFHIKHNKELGELNLRILEKKQQIKWAQAEKKRTFWEAQQREFYLWDFEKAWEEYQSAKKEYEEYRYGYALTQNDEQQTLDEEQQKQLKLMFRQASKLCHPDVVSPEYRNMAEVIFKDLSYAYERNQLEKVKTIFLQLQNNKALANLKEHSFELQLIKRELEKRSMRVEKLSLEIKEIIYSETYRLLQVLDDWDEYFEQKKIQLQEVLVQLETENGNWEPKFKR
jgi:hypothetical protein